MLIRRENKSDYESIYDVVKTAFESADHEDGNEQDLVNALRNGDSYISELSLVAEIDGIIVGHVMFTKAWVGDIPVLALAPLSVIPEYQRKGIGTALVKGIVYCWGCVFWVYCKLIIVKGADNVAHHLTGYGQATGVIAVRD